MLYLRDSHSLAAATDIPPLVPKINLGVSGPDLTLEEQAWIQLWATGAAEEPDVLEVPAADWLAARTDSPLLGRRFLELSDEIERWMNECDAASMGELRRDPAAHRDAATHRRFTSEIVASIERARGTSIPPVMLTVIILPVAGSWAMTAARDRILVSAPLRANRCHLPG